MCSHRRAEEGRKEKLAPGSLGELGLKIEPERLVAEREASALRAAVCNHEQSVRRVDTR